MQQTKTIFESGSFWEPFITGGREYEDPSFAYSTSGTTFSQSDCHKFNPVQFFIKSVLCNLQK